MTGERSQETGEQKSQGAGERESGGTVARLSAAPRLPSTVYHLLLVSLIAASIGWQATNLDAFSLSNDEGAYLMWAWLVHSGHPLYSETVSVSAPLFIALLDWTFDLGGVSVVTGRALVLGFLGLGLLGLAWTGRWLHHRVTGVTAVLAFGVAPLAFFLARVTMAEIPAVALATLAVAAALAYRQRGGRGWLALSGLSLSLSLLTKPLNPLVALPVLWLILARHRDQPRAWTKVAGALVTWGLAGLAPVLLCLVAYDPAALYDQAVAFRFELRATYPWQPGDNLVWLAYFVRRHWGIVGLALAGAVLSARRARWEALIPLGLWLGGALLTVWLHSPLFPHHTIVLLPPLALLAGLAASETIELLRERRWAWSALGLAGGLAFLLALPTAVQANQSARAARFGREAEAIAFLAQVTRPADNVISDNLLLPFMANRQTPPPLGDLAQVAIDSGRQTSERLIAISEAYPVEAVANWALRLPYLDRYMAWVERNYLARRVWDDHHVIYFGRRVSAGQVPNRVDAWLGDAIQLLGYEVASRQRTLDVTLYWRASAPVGDDYTVFVQLLGPDGRLVAQHDGQPLYGYLPTGEWSPGEVIPDRHPLPLPPPEELPSGRYQLVAGMYALDTLERLPARSGGDSVALMWVEIGELRFE